MQSIFDLVGNKIQEIFDAQVVNISTYNAVTREGTLRYVYENGTRTEFLGTLPDHTG